MKMNRIVVEIVVEAARIIGFVVLILGVVWGVAWLIRPATTDRKQAAEWEPTDGVNIVGVEVEGGSFWLRCNEVWTQVDHPCYEVELDAGVAERLRNLEDAFQAYLREEGRYEYTEMELRRK